jgi:alpha-tubulin suppressor-like RCC1 family protein
MGANGEGQLGDGIYNDTNRPCKIVASNVTAIAAGYWHSQFIKSDGSLWVMGDDTYGQLGDGPGSSNTNQPEQIVTSGVMAVDGAYGHSLFVKTNGSLWAMGYNTRGQLGDGANINTNRPEQIVTNGVTAISAGGYHSLFIKSDGSLWATGYNYYGELGNGIYNTVSPWGTNSPQQIVAGVPPGYNLISIQLLSSGNVRLSYVGYAGTNYALERSFSLKPANWVPLFTNPAGAGGIWVITNTPNKTTNNFWRMRFVP